MEKLTRISGLSKSGIETINKATEILCGDISSDAKDKTAVEKAIQNKALSKYLSGISVQELVNMCR